MDIGLLLGLVSLGGTAYAVISSIVTQKNHVKHLTERVVDLEASMKNESMERQAIERQLIEMKGEMKNNHTEMVGKLDNINERCDERHK